MKEIHPLSQDQVVIEKQAVQEKQNILVGRIKPKKGHTLYEVNLVTGDVDKAKFEESVASYHTKTEIVGKGVKAYFKRFNEIAGNPVVQKLMVNKGCIYISALNVKNLKKKLKKMKLIN